MSNLVGVILGNEGTALVSTVKGSACKHNHGTKHLEGTRLKAASGGLMQFRSEHKSNLNINARAQ